MSLWEPVLSVDDYYDGPLSGVAEYRGVVHSYEAFFDYAKDEWAGELRCVEAEQRQKLFHYHYLTPLSQELLAFMDERSDMFRKWQAAYRAGEVEHSTHPVLPEERERYESLGQRQDEYLKAHASNLIQLSFFRRLDALRVPSVHGTWEVSWLEPDPGRLAEALQGNKAEPGL